ncbi:DNA polymerase [Homoserinimonas sp. A520]
MSSYQHRHATQVLQALDADRSPIGVAVDRSHVAVAFASGVTWRATTAGNRDAASARSLVKLLSESARALWTVEPMHRTARGLLKLVPAFDAHRLRNATTAEAIIWADPEHRLAGERGVGVARHDARAASLIAAETAARLSVLDPALRRLALTAVELDQAWRHRVVHGWNVDSDRLEEALDDSEGERSRIFRAAGFDLTATSSDEQKARVIRWLAQADMHPTEDGKPSTSRDAFNLVPEPPIGTEAWNRWRLFRDTKHLTSTQATLFGLDRGLSLGHVHSELRLFSASTGRTSMRQGNLQGLHGPRRNLLRASPGHVLVSIDVAQAELRVAAALSGDPALLRDLESGDVYEGMAKQLFQISTVDLDQRNAAKSLTLGVLYGMGVRALARKLSRTPAEARNLLNTFWGAYPQLMEYRTRLQRSVGTQLYTQTLRRPLAILPKDAGYRALNTCAQAEFADLITVRAVEVARRLGPASLWLALHDELVVEVTPDRGDEAMRILSEVITAPFLGVPMRGEPEVLGRAWRK